MANHCFYCHREVPDGTFECHGCFDETIALEAAELEASLAAEDDDPAA